MSDLSHPRSERRDGGRAEGHELVIRHRGAVLALDEHELVASRVCDLRLRVMPFPDLGLHHSRDILPRTLILSGKAPLVRTGADSTPFCRASVRV